MANNIEMVHTENNFVEWAVFLAHDRYQWQTLASMATKFSVQVGAEIFLNI